MKTVAVTDHDTVDGLRDAEKIKEYEEKYGIEIIKGIEMSCNLEGKDVHILGYFLNLEDRKFLHELDRIANIRNERNEKIIKKLADLKLSCNNGGFGSCCSGKYYKQGTFCRGYAEKRICEL